MPILAIQDADSELLTGNIQQPPDFGGGIYSANARIFHFIKSLLGPVANVV